MLQNVDDYTGRTGSSARKELRGKVAAGYAPVGPAVKIFLEGCRFIDHPATEAAQK
jgi:hypothetical protein